MANSNQHPWRRFHARPLTHGLHAADNRLSRAWLDRAGPKPPPMSRSEPARGSDARYPGPAVVGA